MNLDFVRVLTRPLEWEGAAPFCSTIPGKEHGCNEPDRKSLTYSSFGAGGEERCSRGDYELHPKTFELTDRLPGYKSFCCTQPPPFTGCSW